MKYGLMLNPTNGNIGDDIQSYAESRFLPRVDVEVDREKMDTFKFGDGKEPVALIMGAWFMWRKYNWPPSKQILPLLVGYHHFNRPKKLLDASKSSLPIFADNYDGVGGQWMKDYGPVGCRDLYTCRIFDKKGIPNYFSGCVTLTLPKQPETPDKGTYIVFVDLNKEVEKKVEELAKGKYEIRRMTHSTENIAGVTWEERKKRVIEYLTIYQNAKYVVTRRLHVALPCLAMGVPVMVIQGYRMHDPHRFEPYNEWLHYARNSKFLEEGYDDFDFENGTPNKPDFEKTRDELTKRIEDFISYCEENKDKPLEFFDKTSYSEMELLQWRVEFMKKILGRVHLEEKELYVKYNKLLAKHEKEEARSPVRAFAVQLKRKIKKTKTKK